MDDPGTLIYVAFLVISLVAGWYRNRKKNEEETSTLEPDSFDDEPYQDGTPMYDKKEIERAMAAKMEEDRQARLRLQELVSKPDKAEMPVVPNTTKSFSKRVEEVDEITEHEVNESFDARKAFIYSEIFNAPYI